MKIGKFFSHYPPFHLLKIFQILDGFFLINHFSLTYTKILAKKLNLLYLDTGAMYRALSWFLINENINYKISSEPYEYERVSPKSELIKKLLVKLLIFINFKKINKEIFIF